MGSIYKGKWSVKDKNIDFIVELNQGGDGEDTEVKAGSVWVDLVQGMSLAGSSSTISMISKLWTVNSVSFCPIMEFIAHVQCNNSPLYNECLKSLITRALIPSFIEPESLIQLDQDDIQDPIMMESLVNVEMEELNTEDYFSSERDTLNTTDDLWKPIRNKIPFNKPNRKEKRLNEDQDPEFTIAKEEFEDKLNRSMKVEQADHSLNDEHAELDEDAEPEDQDDVMGYNELEDDYEPLRPKKRRGRGRPPKLKENFADPRVCDECEKSFDGCLELYNHQVTSHPETPATPIDRPDEELFPCTVCPCIFEDAARLKNHNYKRHTNKIPCPICDNVFASENRLHSHCMTKHKKQKHLWPVPQSIPGGVRLSHLMERPDLKCGLCHLPLQNLFGLAKHERGHVEAHICILCGVPCHSTDLLIEHTDSQHGDKNEFLCRQCGFFCYNEKSLSQHVQHKHEKTTKEHACDQCTFVTPVLSTYKAHVRTHKLSQLGKVYVCDECGKEFPCLSKIQNHKKSHLAEKNAIYSCQYCNKRFHLISVLKIHERVHTGEKPYDCKDCSHKFGSRSALIKHRENMHTSLEDMAYRCDECGKGFSKSRKKLYLGHLKQHSGIKDHQCPSCSASFSCRPYLANHFKKVHKQKLTDVQTFVSMESELPANFPLVEDPITISIVN